MIAAEYRPVVQQITPQQMHSDLVRRFGGAGVSMVVAGGDWIIEVDQSVEPPQVVACETTSDTGFLLDGELIHIRTAGERRWSVFIDAANEQRALEFLYREFGGGHGQSRS